jgi:hypothetical protein
MARRKADGSAQRLLDAWVPSSDAGEPLGCVATTYTFDPLFFEEHCLSRFLRLKTDPREDGAAYLIEREDKLAQTTVSVLVDRATAEGSASPRWDVLPVALPSGIQHAKISVLGWHGRIRVIIGSANLTELGYRKNQELCGVLDFHEGGEVPLGTLEAILGFLQGLTDFAPGSPTESGPKARLAGLIQKLRETARRWTMESRRGEWPRVEPMLSGPMEQFNEAIPARLGNLIRERGGPAHSACVLSPFFDKADRTTYQPTKALVEALTERGDRWIELLVPVESLPDGRLRFRAPRSLVEPGPRRAEFGVFPVRDEADSELRPLHSKMVWIWNDRWNVCMIGSSNFTSAGLGLHDRARNAEANLVYVFPEEGKLVAAIESTLPEWEDQVENLDKALWEPVEEVDGEGGGGEAPLPLGFHEAIYDVTEGKPVLTLRFADGLPARWAIAGPGAPDLYASASWDAAGRPNPANLHWPGATIPSALEVRWWDAEGTSHAAPWPVNVRDLGRLPPPDELRNLSLETLVEILGSRLPLHEAVARARRRASVRAAGGADVELDPHRRVRTETFLLQRTRRVARAIEHLVENLNRPVAHRDALSWRLRGPVGPAALARALTEAASSPGEAAFLLADLTLALRRVQVEKVAAGLDAAEVRAEIVAVRRDIESMARQFLADPAMPSRMAQYVEQTLAEVAQ